jgi:hypothetical protein
LLDKVIEFNGSIRGQTNLVPKYNLLLVAGYLLIRKAQKSVTFSCFPTMEVGSLLTSYSQQDFRESRIAANPAL